jgi:hypothetical protein
MLNGKAMTIDADESTELLPGDVLNVDAPGASAKREALGSRAASYEDATNAKQFATATGAATFGNGVETVESCVRLMLQDQTPPKCLALLDALRADIVAPAEPTRFIPAAELTQTKKR